MAKKTKQIVFRVSESMYNRLQDNADARNISVSDYLRLIVQPSMYRHGTGLAPHTQSKKHQLFVN